MTYAHAALLKPAVPMPPAALTPVSSAIARASARTGVDFSYLMNKAQIESSLNPSAKARTSSATGLYQFTQKTWLEMVRDYGNKYGLSHYATAIDDKCRVADGGLRREILALRNDPETAACMAAEYAAQNAAVLERRLGGSCEIGDTELYLAHFLGAGGAGKFLSAMQKNPDAAAASIFGAEARVNKGVFFDPQTGAPRSFQDIYDRFAARMQDEGEDGGSVPSTALAAAGGVAPRSSSFYVPPLMQEKEHTMATSAFEASFETPSHRFVDALLAAPAEGPSRISPSGRMGGFSPWAMTQGPDEAEQAMSQAALLVMIQGERDRSRA